MREIDKYVFVDTATNGTRNRNRIMKHTDYAPPAKSRDCFMTCLRFTEELLDYSENNRTPTTNKPSVAGYPGPAYAPFLPFDLDHKSDPGQAVSEAASLLRQWERDLGLAPEATRIFWSGSKGISIEVPGELFGGFEPHENIAFTLRAIAKKMASGADTLDANIYDKLRLWRLPNTRHGGNGLYKIPLSSRELDDLPRIRALAERPRYIESAQAANEALPALVELRDAAIRREEGRRTKLVSDSALVASVSGVSPDLSYLSERMRRLVRRGNHGEYGSRSQADMAVCTAMFRTGYSAEEVWAVMTNPSNGISEKFLEKGRRGEDYLERTISKARDYSRTEFRGMAKIHGTRDGEACIE